MRASGILLPVASLPSEYGIGCFSKEAYQFIDFLEEAGQKYWQVLPLGPTGYGDSPYQSFSTFAGNPYFINLEELIENGWLTKQECERFDFGHRLDQIDYEKIYYARFAVLNIAYKHANIKEEKEFETFCKENAFWLKDYSRYMAIKDLFQGVSWKHWKEEIRLREEAELNKYDLLLEENICFYQFLQYIFYKQWFKLKKYANKKGIQIIGDIPIYVAFDSADTWANPKLFQFDKENIPIAVAGCPPDGFSATGQLWGNPLYNWEYHKEHSYYWWILRMKHCFSLYDIVRVDHFRGFDEYYTIPYGNKTAEKGEWKKGPGIALFQEIKKQLGNVQIIAEDLGYLTESVKELVEATGYPGMKILQFAFDSREESDYLPHNYNKNCVVYTGTHDNNTIKGWYPTISEEDRIFCREYMNNENGKQEELVWDFIRLAVSSVANLAIIPLQDYLEKGSEARINTPSTLGGNWNWRLQKEEITEQLTQKIKKITRLYHR